LKFKSTLVFGDKTMLRLVKTVLSLRQPCAFITLGLFAACTDAAARDVEPQRSLVSAASAAHRAGGSPHLTVGRGEESFRHGTAMAASAPTSMLEPSELGPVQDVSKGAFHLDLAAHRNCACFGDEAAARDGTDRVEIRDARNGEPLLLAQPHFLRGSANRRRYFDYEQSV
jgi:hypothetical protein